MKRKESRRVRLLRLFARARRPLSFAEVLATYARHHPAETNGHEALSSALGALLHTGEMARVGRGRGVVQYRLARRASAQSAPKRRYELLEPLAWEIVDRLYRATGAPVSTGDIRRVLKERGSWPDRFPRLVAMLEAMARDSADARPFSTRAARSAAALRRVAAAPSRGKVAGFWVPAWAPPQCALSAPTAADALRYAIAAAFREAGMPVSQRELRWWIAAQPADSWWRRDLSPARTGAALRNVSRRDRAHDGKRDTLHVVEGPLTCHGGAPKRYTIGPPHQATILACHMTDAVAMLELDRELESRVELAGVRLPARVRRRLAHARETAVHVALTSYCGSLDARAFGAARRRRTRALNIIERWQAVTASEHEAVAIAQRIERQRESARWRAAATIVRQLAANAARSSSRQRGMEVGGIVGKAALITPGDALRYVVKKKTAGEITAPRPGLVYSIARRFPVTAATALGSARAVRLVPGDALALLDAVDVWCAVQRRAARERGDDGATARQCNVVTLLGTVLRDAALIDALREDRGIPPENRRMFDRVSQLLRGHMAKTDHG